MPEDTFLLFSDRLEELKTLKPLEKNKNMNFCHSPWIIKSYHWTCCSCPSLTSSTSHLPCAIYQKQQLANDKWILLETKTKYLYFIRRWWGSLSVCHNKLHVKRPLLCLWLLNPPSWIIENIFTDCWARSCGVITISVSLTASCLLFS